MKCLRLFILILTVLSTSSAFGQNRTAKPPEPVKPVTVIQPAKSNSPQDSEASARTVQYTDKVLVKIKTKLRFTTLIVLPKNEEILDFISGDKDLWVINGNLNLAYVKPSKSGAQTDLILVTASGNIYAFLLAEVSDTTDGNPDLKVIVESKDESFLATAAGPPKFVSSQTFDDYRRHADLAVDDYQRQADAAKEETRQVKATTQSTIDRGFSQFLLKLRFPYRFEAYKKPFWVRAIFNDGKFTYIEARPEEVPALYEVKDGKPSFVNFKFENGVYVVEKILDHGYLAIGKEKLSFSQEE